MPDGEVICPNILLSLSIDSRTPDSDTVRLH